MRACVVNYNITFRLIEADNRSDVRFGTERTLIRPVLLLALAR